MMQNYGWIQENTGWFCKGMGLMGGMVVVMITSYELLVLN